MISDPDLFISLYLDEDVHKRAAAALRAAGFDAVSVTEANRRGHSDEEQLEFAAGEGRAIVTFNRGHYSILHRKWLLEGGQHAGIILASQQDIGELLRRLRELLNNTTADEMRNQLLWL